MGLVLLCFAKVEAVTMPDQGPFERLDDLDWLSSTMKRDERRYILTRVPFRLY